MRKALLLSVLILIVIIACNINKNNVDTTAVSEKRTSEYGIAVNDMLVLKGQINEDEDLQAITSDLLGNNESLPQELKEQELRTGAKYTILASQDSTLQYIIYEPTPLSYTIFDMTDKQNLAVTKIKREITDKEDVRTLEIDEVMMELVYGDTSKEKLTLLAEVFDYYEIQAGDQVSVAFEKKYADDQFLFINKIKAIKVENKENENMAFLFEEDGKMKYVTEDGRNVQPRFIKAPLKYKRISSKFSLTRKHPVTKKVKPHYGTDFAAPTGTPIWSTAEGVVVKKSYSRGNGNYIVVKHDEVYSTQYLHMSKFAKGIKRGSKVEKGEVIGYVGKTGLASGPHLCYRFWVNGVQVDPLSNKEILHDRLASESLSEFKKMKKEIEGYFTSISI